jgi:hypothetical protein
MTPIAACEPLLACPLVQIDPLVQIEMVDMMMSLLRDVQAETIVTTAFKATITPRKKELLPTVTTFLTNHSSFRQTPSDERDDRQENHDRHRAEQEVGIGKAPRAGRSETL